MDIEKYRNTMLEVFPFIHDMKTSEYKYMMGNIYFSNIKKGEYIMGSHDRCESIPMVLSGSLRLFRTSEEGREMTGYFVDKGSICILAAVCILASIEYDFTTQADEDTVAAMIPPESFMHLMETSNGFKNYIFIEMAEKLISALTLIEDIKFTKVEDRIMDYLKNNSGNDDVIEITHENLAVNIGSVREVVSRTLKKLEDEGRLERKRGKIKIILGD